MKSLFSIYSPDDDKDFLEISNNPNYKPVLPIIDEYINRYLPFADKNFISQIRKDFKSRMWELWIGNILLYQDYLLEIRNATVWPDFIAIKGGKKYFIEAICPSNASEESGNQVPDLNPFVFQELKSDRYEMRIQNAILEKYQKKYIEEIKMVKNPYIIAVNVCKLPFSTFSFGDIPWIIKSLYPIGPEKVLIDHTNNSFTVYREKKISNKKNSGYVMDKCLFTTSKYEFLSAIIYSDIPINLEEENITSKAYILRNPNAIYPITENFGMDEIVIDFNEDTLNWRIIERDI